MSTQYVARSYALHAPTFFGTMVVAIGVVLPLGLGILGFAAAETWPDLMVSGGLWLGFLTGLALLLSTVRVAVQVHVGDEGFATERFPSFIAGAWTTWEDLTHVRVAELGLHELAQHSLVMACLAVLGGARKARVVAFGTGAKEVVTMTTLTPDQVWSRIEAVAPASEIARLRAAGTGGLGRPTTL